jgi:hypothetical protein
MRVGARQCATGEFNTQEKGMDDTVSLLIARAGASTANRIVPRYIEDSAQDKAKMYST